MTLADDLRAAAGEPKGPPCSTRLLLGRLSIEDRAALMAALEDPMVTTAIIARVLRARGHDTSAHNLQRHRRGDCKCSPTS